MIALRSTAGFTLVEVLVAVTVAGIVMVSGFGALAMVQERGDQAYSSTTSVIEGASARAQIVSWLEGARLRDSELDEEFQGLDAGETSIPHDMLYFPTTAETPLEARTTLVLYTVDSDPATPEQGLVAVMWTDLTDPPRRFEIAPEVVDLEVRYRPDVDGEVEWMTSWVGMGELPRAVEIRLMPSVDGELSPLLRLPIRVTLATLR